MDMGLHGNDQERRTEWSRLAPGQWIGGWVRKSRFQKKRPCIDNLGKYMPANLASEYYKHYFVRAFKSDIAKHQLPAQSTVDMMPSLSLHQVHFMHPRTDIVGAYSRSKTPTKGIPGTTSTFVVNLKPTQRRKK